MGILVVRFHMVGKPYQGFQALPGENGSFFMTSYGEGILKILLYHLIPEELNGEKIEILERKRPDFLHGLELDFYIPKLCLAFEFQGEQHYAVDGKFIKSYAGLKKRLFYDISKRKLCKENGINLVTIGAKYLKTKNFRSYLMHFCDKNSLSILKGLVSKKLFKKEEVKKILYIDKRVKKYLKSLGKNKLTNYSNRYPDLLVRTQEKEFKFNQYSS